MGIIESPISISDMSSNVTNVLKFMAERKVKMHQINCKGISQNYFLSFADRLMHGSCLIENNFLSIFSSFLQ